MPRVGIVEAEELVAILEALAPERRVERMAGVIELDEHVLPGLAVARAARAEHEAKLRPVLVRAGPPREGHRRAVHAEQSAAAVDELDQALPQRGVLKQIAHRVVEEDRIELLEVLWPEDHGIAADHGLEGAGLLSHPREGHVGGGDGAVSAVSDIEAEDQQLAGLAGRHDGLGRERSLDLLPLLGADGSPRSCGGKPTPQRREHRRRADRFCLAFHDCCFSK